MNLYIPAAALGIVLVVKLPSLVRRRHSPVVRSVNAVILLQALAFFFSAPPTIRIVNRTTGVSNFSALLVYCVLSAYACACRVLMENWRGDVEVLPRTRRRVRRWIWGHGVVVLLLIGCFVCGEAPVERQRDFETYYASTPFVREMVLLCLFAVTAAAAAAAAACLRWARDIRSEFPERRTPARGLLRIGLTVLAVGFLTNVTYGAAKLVAVVAAWSGRDWEPLNQAAVSLAALGTLLVAAGFLIPIVGPWLAVRVLEPLRTLRALGPLRRTLCGVGGPQARMRLATPWSAGPGRRLTDRMTDIHDRMLELGAYCSDEVRARGYAEARRAGRTEAESVAFGLAAMVRAAADARGRGMPADKERGVPAVRALRAAEGEDRDLLVGISRALGSVPEDGNGGTTASVGGAALSPCDG
ncbi:MAB_1171c family putative transporter [Streptomyces sp. NPDC055893]